AVRGRSPGPCATSRGLGPRCRSLRGSASTHRRPCIRSRIRSVGRASSPSFLVRDHLAQDDSDLAARLHLPHPLVGAVRREGPVVILPFYPLALFVLVMPDVLELH